MPLLGLSQSLRQCLLPNIALLGVGGRVDRETITEGQLHLLLGLQELRGERKNGILFHLLKHLEVTESLVSGTCIDGSSRYIHPLALGPLVPLA